MLSKLVRFLSPPHFEDEEKNRIARILYVLMLTLFVAALIIGIVEAVAGSLSTVPVIVVGCSLLLGVLWLAKRGNLQAASMFLLLIMTGMVTVLLSIGQGVHDIGMILYPIIIIIAALLLDRRNFIIVVALNILSVGYIIIGDIAGVIVTGEYIITTRPVDFIIVGILLVLAAYAIRLLADDLHSSLRRARENESKLKQSNIELEERARQLTLSEARWRTVIENAPDTVLSITEDGTIIFSNQLDDQGNDEQKGRSIYELLLPEDCDRARQMIEELFRTGAPKTFEGQIFDRGHDLRWFSIRLGPVRQPDGKVVNGILIVTDIHDQKQAREALHASEEALQQSTEYLAALN